MSHKCNTSSYGDFIHLVYGRLFKKPCGSIADEAARLLALEAKIHLLFALALSLLAGFAKMSVGCGSSMVINPALNLVLFYALMVTAMFLIRISLVDKIF